MYEPNYIKIKTFYQKTKRHHGVQTHCKNLENRESGKEKLYRPPATTAAATADGMSTQDRAPARERRSGGPSVSEPGETSDGA